MKRSFTLFLLTLFFTPLSQAQVVFSSNFDGVGSIVREKMFTDSSITSGGWTAQDVQGGQSWQIGNFSGSNPYAEMQAFYDTGQDTAEKNEDWYISPKLDGTQGLYLEFINAKNFAGPDLELVASTDYDGTSAPSTATWDTLSYNKSTGGYDWVSSGSIDLTAYNSTDLYIAFAYSSTDSAGAHWEVDNIRFSTDPIDKWLGSKTSIESDSLSGFTSGVNYGTYGVQMTNEEVGAGKHRRLSTKPLTVDSGQSYEVAYWIRGFGSARAGLYDNHTSDGDFGFSYATWNNYGSGSTWKKMTDTITADTNNAQAEFILSVSGTAPSQHAQFDSVVVQKVSSSPSSLADRKQASKELDVFPNPVSDRLRVRSKGYGMDLNVELMDATGRIVKSRSSEASTRFDFDVADLEAGVYFLRLRNEEEEVQKKVLIR